MATLSVVVVALAALVSGVSATCIDDGGNWYCENVNAITYNNFGMSGSYDKVVDMNGCKTTKQAYSGSMAPLDEEVTVIFRGPIHLKQFAAYAPQASKASKSAKCSTTIHKHHRHAARHAKFHRQEEEPQTPLDEVSQANSNASGHGHEHENKKREVIVATASGEVFSWTTTIGVQGTPTPPVGVSKELYDAPSPNHADIRLANGKGGSAYVGGGSGIKPPSMPAAPVYGSGAPSKPDAPVAAGDMAQTASYHAGSSRADGLVFLKTLYAPLGYCSKNGQSMTTSPQVLDDILVPSNQEFTIFTDQKCSGQNGDCGYFDPEISGNAYHGFSGANKAFIFEFSMPHDNTASGMNADMPSIWLLNSQIVRTQQYGCSCWKSGCGEFDLFEVLAKGDTRMKSTYHSSQSLGSSDYFTRPTGGSIKAAVIMGGSSATIKVLDDAFEIGGSLTKAQIQQIVGGTTAHTVEKLPN